MRNQGGGRGSKRKAETNFVNAYSGASELAPPPASRDVLAVPSKLRKIMRLRSLMAEGERTNGQADQRAGRGSEKKTIKVSKKSSGFKNVKDVEGNGTLEISRRKGPELDSGTPDQPAEKKKTSFASKWKKGEEELKKLVEKMDKREKTGIRTAVSDRRRSFLNEKKKKRKGGCLDADSLPAMNQYDKVEFGDIVQAPPKLSFPRKAAEVKDKNKVQGDQSVMWEKMRLQAIEAYRQRKDSSSSGGKQLRVVNFGDAERERFKE